MTHARPVPASIGLLVLAGLLTGCSGGSPSSAGNPSSGGASSASPTCHINTSTGLFEDCPEASGTATEPPSDASPAVSHTVSVTDVDGYTFDVTFEYTPHGFTKDIASEKPGFSAIRIPLSSTITVTNTTAGRALAFRGFSADDVTFALLAEWPGTSAVCKALRPDSTAACSIELAHTQPGNQLAPGESSTSVTYAGPTNYDAGIAHVPDADYDAVLAALRAPASYAVTYTAADNYRFKGACPDPDLRAVMAGAFAPNSAANLFNASLMPLYDTSATCHATWQLPQPPSE